MKHIMSIVLAILLALLTGCGGAGAAAPSAAAAPADDDKTWELVLGCVANDPASVPDFNTMGVGIQMFADKVKEYTNGRVSIDIKYASILGSNVSMYE